MVQIFLAPPIVSGTVVTLPLDHTHVHCAIIEVDCCLRTFILNIENLIYGKIEHYSEACMDFTAGNKSANRNLHKFGTATYIFVFMPNDRQIM